MRNEVVVSVRESRIENGLNGSVSVFFGMTLAIERESGMWNIFVVRWR